MPQLLEAFARTSDHLEGLQKAVDAAFFRCIRDTERLGFSLDENPPPERPIIIQ